jgi:hypothetical protein
MSSWISSLAEKARKAVDNLADTLVEQANAAQEQIINEQKKVKEEVAKQAKLHDDAALPWETDDEELGILSQDVMEKVFALSLTEQNFSVPPPKLAILPFVFSDKVAVAMRLLALDTNLARMHSKVTSYSTQLSSFKPLVG